jgi:hypothetical protein
MNYQIWYITRYNRLKHISFYVIISSIYKYVLVDEKAKLWKSLD